MQSRRQPLGVNAGGLALLSALPYAEVKDTINAIEHRLSVYGDLDSEQMLDHWRRIHRAGYAVIGNFAAPGVTAEGLPVLNENGMPIEAISIAAIGVRMVETRVAEILPLLRHAGLELTDLLRQ